MDLKTYIRDVPDFPKPGIIFKDITPLLRAPEALDESMERLAAPFKRSPAVRTNRRSGRNDRVARQRNQARTRARTSRRYRVPPLLSCGGVILDGARTPIGNFLGSLAELPAVDLGRAATVEAMRRAGVEGSEIQEAVFGHARQAGNGPNPARQVAYRGGLGEDKPAFTVNMACGSGSKAVQVADMSGRIRSYSLHMQDGSRHAALGIALSRRCDLLVAVARGASDTRLQHAALDFLGKDDMRRWMAAALDGR